MPKISDVARLAGVSPATVSRVLNHPDMVTQDKRDQVLAAMRELEYRPNAVARNLRRGHFDTLALLVGDVSQPFHARLAKAVESAAEEHGYNVVLCDLDHRQDRLIRFLETLPSRAVDGAIIATADTLDVDPVREAIAAALDQGFVVVSAALPLPGLDVPAVVTDHQLAADQATQHLLAQDRWPLVFLGGSRTSAISRLLRSGFQAACRRAGRQPDRRWIISGNFRHDKAHLALGELLDRGPEIRGVVAANTPIALGAMRALSEHGLSIPRDVGIVSCEDVPLADYLRPALTSISIDLDDLGRRTVDTLTTAVAGRTVPHLTHLPHRLVIRDSSVNPAETTERS
ncbi:LacI family DNA-binding transcriptional regulator [Saccharopolyspora shandongensis]|uniref:LacI family DNA-binding transcriptional regulator n=1 Tax=Saccharopolyspora shandongensis TaxID=418495 RepID=UPI00343226A1